MAAEDNLSKQQWEQLPMFMKAGELKSKINVSYDPHRDMEHLWRYKLQEAKTGAIRNARYTPTRARKGASFYDSIKEKGVQKPVLISPNPSYKSPGFHLSEGHHRVAAAADIDPNMLIPVKHENW